MNTQVEAELQALLDDLDVSYKELALKAEDLQDEISMVDGKRETIRSAIRLYREAHGLTAEPAPPGEVLKKQFEGMSYKNILIAITKENGGILSGKDATRIFVTAGLFPNKNRAAARVYNVLGRYPEVFEKIGRGKYKLRNIIQHLAGGTVTITEPLVPPHLKRVDAG